MPQTPTQTLVIDNGAYTIKAGFATPQAGLEACLTVPNCIARGRDKKVFVGSELDSCKDFGGMAFRRPVERVRFRFNLTLPLLQLCVAGCYEY